ncbi:MAG: hypothetical protein L0K82_03445 [Pisciglobus halotolerans]|nr:hypothetical protein [Pisciglobus halotolerans]
MTLTLWFIFIGMWVAIAVLAVYAGIKGYKVYKECIDLPDEELEEEE